jgi:hypothetical protein
MRILVLLICILCLEGCQREERQWRLDPPLAALLPLWHHAEKSKTPAAKSIPVRIEIT